MDPLANPDLCRHLNCWEVPTWFAEIKKTKPTPGRPENWEGYFCTEHLLGVIPLVTKEMAWRQQLTIKKVR
jgi:hypothetical protein